MKILIISCSTGEGHNSAADAVKKEFIKSNDEVDSLDLLSLGSKSQGKILTNSLNSISKNTPKLFGLMYKAGAVYSSTKLTSPIYIINGIFVKKLKEYINSHNYNAVLCSHLYAMETLTHLTKHNEITIPCFGILTDYTGIPFICETKLDGYFIPHLDLVPELVNNGMNENKLFATGIPVDDKFNHHYQKHIACKILNIDNSKKVIMIMTGGIGCGNVQAMCNHLINKINNDYLVFVLVGKNSNLKKELETKYSDFEQIKILSFTKKVNIYMNASDVLITKPGGISSTEAAIANIPLVHAMAIPGCENKNATFFANKGMSYNATNEEDACNEAIKLINNYNISKAMIEKQKSEINPLASHEIVLIIKDFIHINLEK